jgi:WD40 repeat protein
LHYHIWIIDADGGTPRRLTTQGGDEVVPTWSQDGRWIYFSGDQGTGRDIWRVSPSGGSPERLTRGASGPFACESADGKQLLFQPKDADSPLMAMTLPHGGSSADAPVHVLDLESGRDRRLGTIEGLTYRPLGLAVSPDGNTILYPRQVHLSSDLMLIENFR